MFRIIGIGLIIGALMILCVYAHLAGAGFWGPLTLDLPALFFIVSFILGVLCVTYDMWAWHVVVATCFDASPEPGAVAITEDFWQTGARASIVGGGINLLFNAYYAMDVCAYDHVLLGLLWAGGPGLLYSLLLACCVFQPAASRVRNRCFKDEAMEEAEVVSPARSGRGRLWPAPSMSRFDR